MKNGLSRRTTFNSGDVFEKSILNVYDIRTHEIVFTGGFIETANFLGVRAGHVNYYLKTKGRFQKKYAIRRAIEQK